jgi:Lrp/AsnC family leucine-responsive transcriptional regulator
VAPEFARVPPSCEGGETPDGGLWPHKTARREARGPDGCPGHECMLKIYPDTGWISFLKAWSGGPTAGQYSFKIDLSRTNFRPPFMTTRNRPLDNQDRKIMRELQKNARLSNAELAELVGMSTTACWNRTRQLETEGYIRGYVALLDQQKLGFADVVLLEVTLDRHDDDALARFGAELATLSEVLEAYLVSGDYDYLVKVAVDGTAGYERFLREKLYKIAGIRHSRSMFALRCMKSIPSIAI